MKVKIVGTLRVHPQDVAALERAGVHLVRNASQERLHNFTVVRDLPFVVGDLYRLRVAEVTVWGIEMP